MAMPASVRILHICETVKGGIASYLDEIAPFQIATYGAHNIRFVIPRENRDELASIPDECLIMFDYRGRSVKMIFDYIRQIGDIIRNENPTLIHAHSSYAGFASRVFFIGRKRRVRVVYCPHGWSFLMGISPLKRAAFFLVERFLAHYTDAIVNISKYEYEQSIAYGIPAEKSRTVLSAVKSAPKAEKISLAECKINLLFVGRFDRQKGFDLLIEAMRRLVAMPLHLYVAGGGVLEQVSPPKLPNVSYLGWLAREDVNAYFAAADAVVMPSRWEAFGLVATEAMRSGTAVIASNRGALPELVVSGETGLLFRGEDPVALEKALRSLDKGELAKWGKAGLERQVKLFSIDRLNAEIQNVYLSIE